MLPAKCCQSHVGRKLCMHSIASSDGAVQRASCDITQHVDLPGNAVCLRLSGVALLPVRLCRSVPCSTPQWPKPGCSPKLQQFALITCGSAKMNTHSQHHAHSLEPGAQRHRRDLLSAAALAAVGLDRRGSQCTAHASSAHNTLHIPSSERDRLYSGSLPECRAT